MANVIKAGKNNFAVISILCLILGQASAGVNILTNPAWTANW
jgi:hypothetical protein